jgi:hypothetical protein
VFEPSPDLIAGVASRQRSRLRLGPLVETAFLRKGTEKARIYKKRAVRVCDRLHVQGGGMRRGPVEGYVQKKQDFEIPGVGFQKTRLSIFA